MHKKATQLSIKENNLGLLLKIIKENEFITRIELNKITKLAISTVSDLVNFLIEKKILFEGEKINSRLGKKPIILKFNKDLFYIVAINIGIEYITIAIANLFGEIIYKIKKKNVHRENKEKLISYIFSIVDETILKTKISLKKIYLFSIGTHGVVNSQKKITNAPYFKNWSGINLYKIFKQKYNKEILIENSINSGAIGERWKNFPGISDLIYVSVNFGIGAGIIINGQLVTGVNGSSGEIAYLPVQLNHDFKKLKTNTFELGLFESQVDIAGIINRINQEAIRLNKKDFEIINFKYICKIYNDPDDNFVKKIIDEEVIKILSIGIASIITIIDTEIIIINGKILNLGNNFINKLINTIYSIVPFKPKIVFSSLKRDAPIFGVIKLGVDYMDKLLYNHFFSIKL